MPGTVWPRRSLSSSADEFSGSNAANPSPDHPNLSRRHFVREPHSGTPTSNWQRPRMAPMCDGCGQEECSRLEQATLPRTFEQTNPREDVGILSRTDRPLTGCGLPASLHDLRRRGPHRCVKMVGGLGQFRPSSRPALPGPSHATGSWGTLSVSQNVSEIAGN